MGWEKEEYCWSGFWFLSLRGVCAKFEKFDTVGLFVELMGAIESDYEEVDLDF
jgi:hypothetical protein